MHCLTTLNTCSIKKKLSTIVQFYYGNVDLHSISRSLKDKWKLTCLDKIKVSFRWKSGLTVWGEEEEVYFGLDIFLCDETQFSNYIPPECDWDNGIEICSVITFDIFGRKNPCKM